MRSGHLLAEDSPHNLLTLHGLGSLEEVFLKLSTKERAKKHLALSASGRPVAPIELPEEQGHDNAAFVAVAGNPDAVSTPPNIANGVPVSHIG